ncbi:MAG: site-specific integrase [Candidatus Thiodiazotropha taylori]
MASIRKRTRKNGAISFRVDVRLKGFPPQTATFRRLTDAKKWAQDTESAIREGRYFKTAEAKKHTLAELIDRYIRDTIPNKPKQAINQKQQLTWWKDQIGDFSLVEVTPSKITECRDKLLSGITKQGNKRSPSTVNRYMAALSHAFSIAVNEWEWLEESPMRKVKKAKEPRGRVRFLSDDEQDQNGENIEGERSRLLKACKKSRNEYLYPVVVLALSTGMRKGEIMNLTWDDIDLNLGRITLNETKNDERRVVPLVGLSLGLLKEYAKVRRIDTPLLFPGKNRKDEPMDLRAPWLAALKEAGIKDFRFHDLRHSAASYLAMNGASMAEIAEVLGHKTLQMVKRYSHLSEAHTAGVVAAMNERIFSNEQS